jgi:hypothetical protein
MATEKPARKSEPRKPEEYDRFDNLMQRLLRVRKSDVDEAVKREKTKRK